MPLPLITAATAQRLDQETMQRYGVPARLLMQHAGEGFARVAERYLCKKSRVVAVVGVGNNGGDGIVAAHALAKAGHAVGIVWIGARAKLLAEPRRALAALGDLAMVHCTLADDWRTLLAGADCIIDAIFGVGLARPVAEPCASVIAAINHCAVPLISADLPSGLCADTGRVLGTAVRATATATFGLPKRGLVEADGPAHAGRVHVVPIPWTAALVDAVPRDLALLEAGDIVPHLPQRTPDWHKGRSGHAGIIAGSVHAPGAGLLAARACLRAGAGLVTYAFPAAARAQCPLTTPEVMFAPINDATTPGLFALSALPALQALLRGKSALGIGPGLGTAPPTCDCFAELLPTLTGPTVLDADALNIIASRPALLADVEDRPYLLTPHPGEMARLMACSIDTIQQNRLATVRDFARAHRTHLLLKGACSVLAAPDGTLRVNPTGSAALATAGSGDVLTGLATGFLAQGLSITHAAAVAAYLHGLAGEYCAAAIGITGVLASDIADAIPRVCTSLRGTGRSCEQQSDNARS